MVHGLAEQCKAMFGVVDECILHIYRYKSFQENKLRSPLSFLVALFFPFRKKDVSLVGGPKNTHTQKLRTRESRVRTQILRSAHILRCSPFLHRTPHTDARTPPAVLQSTHRDTSPRLEGAVACLLSFWVKI